MTKKELLTSVITGDIIESRGTNSALWMPRLKKALSVEGKNPGSWQVYRGDSFQVEVKDPAMALLTAIRIKAAIKSVKNLDVRMAIGIGAKTYTSAQVAESSGEAFVHSGEMFESLKKRRQTLAIKSKWQSFDRDMNVCFRLASIPMDEWTPVSAELVQLLLKERTITQEAVARKLGVTQPSVSARQNRAHFEEIMDLEELYREKMTLLLTAKK